MSHIFISYSRKDQAFTEEIVAALVEHKLKVWIDREDIPKGEKWLAEIFRGIEEAESILFLISPDAVASSYCRKEIEHATRNNKRIIPLVLRDVKHGEIPEAISERNWIFCRYAEETSGPVAVDDFTTSIEQILETINSDYEWLKYHTKLQVKALDWERQGDHSRLLRGRELHEAEQRLAGVGTGIDPQPTDLQQNFIVTSRKDVRRRTTRTRIFGVVFTLVAAIAVSAAAVLIDRIPATVTVTGRVFEIRNRFNYRFLSRDVGSTISVHAEPRKLTPGGGYVLVLGTGSDGERPGTVLAYDMRGNIEWEFTVDKDPYGGAPGNFKIRHLLVDDLLGNAQSQIIFTAQKSDWYPTQLVLLDSGGRLVSSYWNSGFIYEIIPSDLDGDGIKELVISAVNNNLGYVLVDTPSKHPVTVFVLSPSRDFTGQTFPDLIAGVPGGTEYNQWVAIFEPFEVTSIFLRIAEEDGKNLVEVVFNPQGGYLWMDAFGRIQKVGVSDYWQPLQGGRSPADFVCFLQYDGGDWYFSPQVDQDGSCPWYVRE